MTSKFVISVFVFIISYSAYSQSDRPKFVLVNTYYYANKTLALVVRFDKGIDSITFPVDTTLVKTFIRKLDSNGKELSPRKVYYEYYFSPQVDTVYKLPLAQVWNDGKPFKIVLDKYVSLKIPPKPVMLSKSDSLKFKAEQQRQRIERRKKSEKERLEGKVDSRISRNITQPTVLLWTDKNVVKVSDIFRIVIESNTEFYTEANTFDCSINQSSDKIKVLRKLSGSNYEDGAGNHYVIFVCKALSKGNVSINSLTIKTEKDILRTNQWIFEIID